MDKGYLTFHRSPERHARYLRGADGPIFDPVTKAWIISNPGCCERLLTSPDTRPATYSDDYAALEKRLGIDFSNVLLAFLHIPMCLHEEAHRKARRRVAEHLAARKSDLSDSMSKSLAAHLEPLRREGEPEIMSEVLLPLVLGVTEPLTDVPPAIAAQCRTVSTIFDKSIGPRKRQRIDAELGLMRAAIIGKLGPDASEDAVGLRLALAVLGRDTLMGTIGASLYSILSANPGRRLNEISYPEMPPEPAYRTSRGSPSTRFPTSRRGSMPVTEFAYIFRPLHIPNRLWTSPKSLVSAVISAWGKPCLSISGER